jgi:hypothetical protein
MNVTCGEIPKNSQLASKNSFTRAFLLKKGNQEISTVAKDFEGDCCPEYKVLG